MNRVKNNSRWLIADGQGFREIGSGIEDLNRRFPRLPRLSRAELGAWAFCAGALTMTIIWVVVVVENYLPLLPKD